MLFDFATLYQNPWLFLPFSPLLTILTSFSLFVSPSFLFALSVYFPSFSSFLVYVIRRSAHFLCRIRPSSFSPYFFSGLVQSFSDLLKSFSGLLESFSAFPKVSRTLLKVSQAFQKVSRAFLKVSPSHRSFSRLFQFLSPPFFPGSFILFSPPFSQKADFSVRSISSHLPSLFLCSASFFTALSFVPSPSPA